MHVASPPPPLWTEAIDAQLRRLHAEGIEWPEIARILGREHPDIVVRAGLIGALPPPDDFIPPQDDPSRDPLPAGHPRSWRPLVRGTLLEGTDYPLPFFFR